MCPNDTTNQIPYGYCHCGCGQLAPIAKKHHKRSGHTKGQPVRFIKGHNVRSAPVSEKRCTLCGEIKPATEEYFSRRKNGLHARCKVCQANRKRAYYEANKEHTAEYKRAYYIANREQHLENRRAYVAANREKVLEGMRNWWAANRERNRAYYEANRESRAAWRVVNKERIAKRGQAWRVANRDRARAHWRNYMARKRNAEGTHTAEDIQQQYKRQKGRCFWCGCKVNDRFHVDHVIPLSRGGNNYSTNLVISCHSCNESRGNRLPSEWPQGNRLL